MSRVSKVETVFDLYVKGAKVWIPDPEEGWLSALLERTHVDDLGNIVLYLLTVDGRRITTSVSLKTIPDTKGIELPPLKNPPILEGIDDLTGLSYLHEPAVLHNIRTRYSQHNIYTYSGIVLIAVNPFQRVNLYSEDIIKAYCNKRRGELEPHLFAVAEDAYRSMVRDRKDQSIIVSGESGAGKTVSAKYIMRYFAAADDSGHGLGSNGKTNCSSSERPNSPRKIQISEVEEQVLATNPIMESFGNAKTTRNDNSSRFGKYIEILFGDKSKIVGARIRTYLLERSRCVYQPETERNYHIFYQLCAGAPAAEKRELGLSNLRNFHYLNQGGGSGLIAGVDDAAEFEVTQRALSIVGISVNTQWRIFRMLAALLHLGNIEVTKLGSANDAFVREDDASMRFACRLLDIDVGKLRKWLMKKRIVARTETVETNLSVQNSFMMRDSCTKYVYSALFEWIVSKVNEALCDDEVQSQAKHFIGVLDIYGFEHFKRNSFEQFCINYANEKLQQEFNQHVFKLEQEEYIKEQIDWSFIDFNDNQPCIDLIEGRLGILALLDEESRLPSGSDTSLIQKLYKQFLENEKRRTSSTFSPSVPVKSPPSVVNAQDPQCRKSEPRDYFGKPRFSQASFVVRHFAHEVAYEVEGFLDKNRDTVSDELLEVLKSSRSEFLQAVIASHKSCIAESVAPTTLDRSGRRSITSMTDRSSVVSPRGVRSKAVTLGSVFKHSLTQLMDTIHSTNVSYIRCIKPNAQKKPFHFESLMVLSQLRACGVLETIRISTAGYPGRWSFEEFAERYYLLLPSDRWTDDVRRLCAGILAGTVKDSDKYQIGLSKIFFRAGQLAYLEKLRSDKLDRCVTLIQKNVRRLIRRRHYLKLREYTVFVQSRWRGKTQRRNYEQMRQNRAATIIQTNWRGYVARQRFLQIRDAAHKIQCAWRYHVARRKLANLRDTRAVVAIQAVWRGYSMRQAIQRQRKLIIWTQSCVRRRRAVRILRQLKIEARSVNHFKKISYKLENKVVEITQTLASREAENRTLQERLDHAESQIKFWKERNDKADGRVKQAIQREKSFIISKRDVEALQNEKQKVESQLNTAHDAIKARDSEILQLKETVSKLSEDIAKLQEQIKESDTRDQLVEELQSSKEQVASLRKEVGELRSAARQAREQISRNRLANVQSTASISWAMQNRKHPPKSGILSGLGRLDQTLLEGSPVRARKSRRHSSADSWSRTHTENVVPQTVTFRPQRMSQRTSPSSNKSPTPADEALREEEQTRQLLQDKKLHEEITNCVIARYNIPSPLQTDCSRKDIICPSQILGILLIQLWRHGMATQMHAVMSKAIKAIEDRCMTVDDDGTVCFWLANIYEIQSIIKSTKEERERSGLSITSGSGRYSKRQSYSPHERRPASAMDADRIASKIKTDLDYLVIDIYANWLRSLRRRLFKYIIPAVIENQSLPGFISKDPSSTGFLKKRIQQPAYTTDDLLTFFNDITTILHFYKVDDMIIRQTLSELLKTTGVNSFNHLIMRKNFCTWKRGMQIQYNVSRIIEWCNVQNLHEGAINLERLMQAAKLLQLNKASPGNVELYCEDLFDVCFLLSPAQIKKLMSIYTVGDYENPISPEILKAVASRSAISEKNDNLFLAQTPENDTSWFERPEPRRIGVIDKYMPPEIEKDVPRVVLLLKFA